MLDHSTFAWPYNGLVHLFSRVPNVAYHDTGDFPALAPLAANWQLIRDEGLRLLEMGAIRAATGANDVGFNTFYRRGWRRFYLKWYDEPMASAERLCPGTVRLLRSLPLVRGAMFALLPPGGRLGRHRDPFAGCLRYHLGLATPNDDACWIEVDGARYSWRDGQCIVFDETYVHSVENATATGRLILFCDIERPLHWPMSWINRVVSRTVMRATVTQNEAGERIGLINRIAAPFLTLHAMTRQVKTSDRRGYYRMKRMVGAVVLIALLALLWVLPRG
ncbi:MAG: aspartyl/asparaginyl beta-hydroxylase domain-containing protein [Acetobacteraceae bacterium]